MVVVINKKGKINQLAKKLRISSQPKRIEILCFLFDNQDVCVSDIAKALRLSIAVASYHLQALAKENLVVSNRKGKMICYRLSPEKFANDLKKLICKYK